MSSQNFQDPVVPILSDECNERNAERIHEFVVFDAGNVRRRFSDIWDEILAVSLVGCERDLLDISQSSNVKPRVFAIVLLYVVDYSFNQQAIHGTAICSETYRKLVLYLIMALWGSLHLRIKIWVFDVHQVMKPVGGAKIPWSVKRFL